MNLSFPKKSFKRKLIISFFVFSILPVIIFSIFTTISTKQIINESSKKLVQSNIVQVKRGINERIKYFDNLLYRLYTDDQVVKSVQGINNEENIELHVNQLHQLLLSFMSAQEEIASIMIITNDNRKIFYDSLTGSFNTSSWCTKLSVNDKKILKSTSEKFETTLIPTMFVGEYSGKSQYLYHMSHRIFDYKNISKDLGVIVLSLKEQTLSDVYSEGQLSDSSGIRVIIDKNGNVISSNEDFFLKNKILANNKNIQKQILENVSDRRMLDSEQLISDKINIENWGWSLFSIDDISEIENKLINRNGAIIIATLLLIFILSFFILRLVGKLSLSINSITETIKRSQNGDLQIRVPENNSDLKEVQIIASEFNLLMDRIDLLINEIRDAARTQKEIEMTLLESQINPHFIYNTLDSINWLAIENDQFVISSMITSLARIMRYGINNINQEVTIDQEIEWMKNYLNLQQIRYKNQFEYRIFVSTGLTSFKIRKLLFQPFIENSIVHGLNNLSKTMSIFINLYRFKDALLVFILDDGIGIDVNDLEAIVKSMNSDDKSSHIGMHNSLNRMRMYYGMKQTRIEFLSEKNVGTLVLITIEEFFND